MMNTLRCLLLTELLVHAFYAHSQEQPARPFQYYPQAPGFGSFRHAVDISFGKPPMDLLEEGSYVRVPLLEYDGVFSLPAGFSVEGRVSTIVVSNHVSLGPRWTWMAGSWGFSVGFDVAYLFGQLEQYGFNNSIKAWINYPCISVGHDFGKVAITMKAELSIVTSRTVFTDDIEVGSDKNEFNGGSIALFMEQPLWKDNYVILGIKMGYLKQWYPTWLVFSTFDKKYVIPEFIIGYIL